MERWLAGRVERKDVLDQVAGDTLVHPIRHGARVQLPKADRDQMDLFGNF